MNARLVSRMAIPSLLLLATTPGWGAQDVTSGLRVDGGRLERRILELAAYGRNEDGGVDRVAFSEADQEARAWIRELMREAGLEVGVDAAGNIIGRRKGNDPSLGPIMMGSHIDSVPGGGNYDGDVGVMGAIEVAQTLEEHGVRTRHPLEVIVFCDEEGSLVGSRALAGHVGPDVLDFMSHSGKTVGEGLEAIGGAPRRLAEVARRPGEVTAFLELHIEQGGVLDAGGIEIGVVEGIVGIRWWDVVVTGVANHAGTTPMNRRHDALVAAARLTMAVNRIVTSRPGTQVGTVGRIRAEPGAPNVVPGKVVMSLELRDLSSQVIESLHEAIEAESRSIARDTGTEIRLVELDAATRPAPTDARVREIIAAAARRLGLSFKQMPSGAGHDAQEMATIAPTGMVFVPSVGGISHSPREFTRPQDMANGANVLLEAVLAIDGGALERR